MVSFQLVADPCASHPCHHGNCSSSGSGDGYLCICNEGYEGPNCEQALSSVPASGWTESTAPRQLQPVPATQEPEIMLPRSQATITLPTWQPKTGQKVVEMKWDQVEVVPDIACGNASANSSAGGRLVSFEVPQNTSVKIRQDATASLILLWKVTATGFQQCSLIDGRSVTLLQAPGGLVLLEEMLALGQNHFIGFVNDSVTKSIVALRLTLVVKTSTCVPGESHANGLECSGRGRCSTKPSEATFSCNCDDQYTGTFCEEFDACQKKPCQNNASCVDAKEKQDGGNFTCVCLAGSIIGAITSLMSRAASSALTLAPHRLPLCLFLDSLPVYDGSPSAMHTASFQCPHSNLVICCLNDCDKPVTLATLPCLRLQGNLPEAQDQSPAEGEQSLSCYSSSV
ncbi:hypothetical protein K5549_006042 [Capra hircus]|nr:hypothetical protein K5549_006042 [Capra hircus]